MGISQNFVSVTRRPPDVEDYIDMMRRHRSWIIGPMFAGLVISTVVAFLWHDTFVSTALLRITPQQVSERLVPAQFNTQMTQRLSQMQEEVVSRTSLEALIRKPTLELYKKELATKPMEDVVQDMRKDIHINPVVTSNQSGDRVASAFQVSFQYDNPYKAQQVVQELTSKFMEQTITQQRNQAHLTGSFLSDELVKSKENLDRLDAALTKFRMENPGKLPEEFQSNISTINSSQFDNSNLTAQLDHARSMKMSLEAQLKNSVDMESYWEGQAETTVVNSAQATMQNQELINVTNQLSNLKATLAGLKQHFGENYPDVGATNAQIQVVEQRKREIEKEQAAKETPAAAGPTVSKVTNPQARTMLVNIKGAIEMTKTQLKEADLDISRLTRQQEDLNRKIAMYQQRIESAPLVQQEYASLMREYQLANTEYQDKVKKKEQSDTSQNLEEHQGGEKLELLDPALIPEKPTQPNRPQWAGIGTAAGLMLGIVLAGAKEMKDTSLKNLKDVRAYTNLPVLSSVPLLENALLVRRKRRLFWLAWSSAFIFGTAAMSGSAYYYYFASH